MCINSFSLVFTAPQLNAYTGDCLGLQDRNQGTWSLICEAIPVSRQCLNPFSFGCHLCASTPLPTEIGRRFWNPPGNTSVGTFYRRCWVCQRPASVQVKKRDIRAHVGRLQAGGMFSIAYVFGIPRLLERRSLGISVPRKRPISI